MFRRGPQTQEAEAVPYRHLQFTLSGALTRALKGRLLALSKRTRSEPQHTILTRQALWLQTRSPELRPSTSAHAPLKQPANGRRTCKDTVSHASSKAACLRITCRIQTAGARFASLHAMVNNWTRAAAITAHEKMDGSFACASAMAKQRTMLAACTKAKQVDLNIRVHTCHGEASNYACCKRRGRANGCGAAIKPRLVGFIHRNLQ
eukprot:1136972-Pelagomonas_calceolata.AAC.6